MGFDGLSAWLLRKISEGISLKFKVICLLCVTIVILKNIFMTLHSSIHSKFLGTFLIRLSNVNNVVVHPHGKDLFQWEIG